MIKDKHILITGAASGIGLHMGKAMLAAGHRVSLCDINADKLEEHFGQHQKKERLRLIKLDVTSVESWEAAIEKGLSAFGDLDYLFNIAGIVNPGFLQNTTIPELDQQIDINTKGMMYGAKLCSDQMIKQGQGHIINVASLAGVVPVSGIAGYTASKFAIRGFSLAIAHDLMDLGVHVSVICPDLVRTPMLDQELDHAEEAALVFSGNKALTVEEIEAGFVKLMNKPQLEILLPPSRGVLSKSASFFPKLNTILASHLRKKGKAAIEKERKAQGL